MKKQLYILAIWCAPALLFAQSECFEPDATVWLNTWKSCEVTQGPNSARSAAHWIHYDFGEIQAMSKSWIWNTNEPGQLETGMQQVMIDYSNDGENWTEWGEFTFKQGTGEAVYGGFAGPDLTGIEARHILITALSNYGDPTCAGIAEVKFNLLYDFFLPETLNNVADCDIPDYNKAAGISGNISIILWPEDEDAEGYGIRIRIKDSTDWFSYPVDGAIAYLNTLEPGTTYEYQLRTWCNEAWTEYSDTFEFTAIEPQLECGPPIASQLYFFSPLNAAIIWNLVPNVNTYRVQFREEGQETWTIVDVSELYLGLPGLNENIVYEYQVQALCGDAWSEWTESKFFNSGTSDSPGYFVDEDVSTDVVNLNPYIEVNVSPNPFVNDVHLDYQAVEADILHVDVYDANGKKVWRNIYRTPPGGDRIDLNLPYLSDGIYMIQVQSLETRGVFSDKLVKAGQ